MVSPKWIKSVSRNNGTGTKGIGWANWAQIQCRKATISVISTWVLACQRCCWGEKLLEPVEGLGLPDEPVEGGRVPLLQDIGEEFMECRRFFRDVEQCCFRTL